MRKTVSSHVRAVGRPSGALTSRSVLRLARRALSERLSMQWNGTRASLRTVIRRFLRPYRRQFGFLVRILRDPRFAALVAGAAVAGITGATQAKSTIEVSNITSETRSSMIYDEPVDNRLGKSVSGAGNVKGDGINEFITRAPGDLGYSYQVELSLIAAGIGGFAINGELFGDRFGISVSGAGDVNGDGVADLIVGAPGDVNYGSTGRSYVVFGKADGSVVDLTAIAAGTGGFAINVEALGDHSGISVSSAGDVNGDGLADLIVGAWEADPKGNSSGRSYIVFGKADGSVVELSAITAGNGGFAITGEAAYDYSGWSVSGAGDVNGDGLADVIVGAFGASLKGFYTGRSYVVFGKTGTAEVKLSAIAAGTGGFAVNGEAAGDRSGWSVSTAGDVNGDGLADLIVGAYGADYNGNKSGRSYVVLGKTGTSTVELSAIAAGTGGFAINGEAAGDYSGFSVSAAGDVNGDDLSDLIIGAYGANANGFDSGRSYILFGKTGTAVVELSAITVGTGGFAINGEASGDHSGISVSAAGDVNGDGLADLIVGAPKRGPNGSYAGRTYVVFGQTGTAAVNLSAIVTGTRGFAINGEADYPFSGMSVSAAGDVNGDGLADMIVGAFYANPNDIYSGRSYVVFSPETAATAGTYKMRTLAGDGTGSLVAPVTDFGDVARAKIDFSDNDLASGGGLNSASIETVTLTRNADAVQNLVGPLLPVTWYIATDRAGFNSATVTLKYLNPEIVLIGGPEASLIVFKAPALDGPWTELPSTVNAARNEISVTVNSFSFFAIRAPNKNAVKIWKLYR